MAKEFNIGDIIQLKSGGPKMTVMSLPDVRGGYIRCQWFAGSKLESGSFPQESLEPTTVEKKG